MAGAEGRGGAGGRTEREKQRGWVEIDSAHSQEKLI